jgi:hypothetical protein
MTKKKLVAQYINLLFEEFIELEGLALGILVELGEVNCQVIERLNEVGDSMVAAIRLVREH